MWSMIVYLWSRRTIKIIDLIIDHLPSIHFFYKMIDHLSWIYIFFPCSWPKRKVKETESDQAWKCSIESKKKCKKWECMTKSGELKSDLQLLVTCLILITLNVMLGLMP